MVCCKLFHPDLRKLWRYVNRRQRKIVESLGQLFFVRLMVRAVKESSDDDVSHMAAGVAYYALFSLFPLLSGLTAILSYFLDPVQIQSQVTGITSGFLPGSEDLIKDNINSIPRLRGALGLFSIVGMIWSGSAIFGALNRSINRAWDIQTDRPLYKGKPRQLFMALLVGVLFVLSVGAAALVRMDTTLSQYDFPLQGFFIEQLGRMLLQGISFILVLAIFLSIYKFMPNIKTYWKYIWPGAVVGAVCFEISKSLFIFYLDHWSYQNIYGSVTPVIVLLLWAYVSSLIILAGAELSSEYGRMKSNVERGVLIPTN